MKRWRLASVVAVVLLLGTGWFAAGALGDPAPTGLGGPVVVPGPGAASSSPKTPQTSTPPIDGASGSPTPHTGSAKPSTPAPSPTQHEPGAVKVTPHGTCQAGDDDDEFDDDTHDDDCD